MQSIVEKTIHSMSYYYMFYDKDLITEILLNVALNTITLTLTLEY